MTISASAAATAARRALDALPDLSWSPFARADLPDIAAFYAIVEEHDANPERTSLAELRDYWDSPRSVPEEDTLVGRDADGAVVAAAWSGCNRGMTEVRGVFLGGAVHPRRRGEGIGRAVLRWELAHARTWDAASREPGFGPLRLRLMAPEDQRDVRDLAERSGLTTARWFFEMDRPLDALPALAIPADVGLIGWDPARSEEVRRTVNTAFRDHWGHADETAAMWRDRLEASSFRPEWTVLAVDSKTDRVIGAAWGEAFEQDWSEGRREGYTNDLGVLREHRGHGVASALLVKQMRLFAASGMTTAALGVDAENPSGALRLYEALGYTARSSTCVHELVEEPGSHR